MTGRAIAFSTAVAILLAGPVLAEPFAENWHEKWSPILSDGKVARQDDGSLEFDLNQGQHAFFRGGQVGHDFALTVRAKFISADHKYSGLDLWVRFSGDAWASREDGPMAGRCTNGQTEMEQASRDTGRRLPRGCQ